MYSYEDRIRAVERGMSKLLIAQGRSPHVMFTDKLRS